jgi:hypothetical protein
MPRITLAQAEEHARKIDPEKWDSMSREERREIVRQLNADAARHKEIEAYMAQFAPKPARKKR